MYGKRKRASQSGSSKKRFKRTFRGTQTKRRTGRRLQRPRNRKSYGRKRGRRSAVLSRVSLSLALGTPRSYMINGSSIVTSNAGQMGRQMVHTTNGPGDVAQMFTHALNEQGAGAVGNVVQKSCTSEMLFTNQDRCTVWVKIYRCLARKDIAAGEGVADEIINEGWSDQGQPSNYLMYGQTLFHNHKFTSLFKVLGTTNFKLDAGVTAKRTFRDKGRMNWNRAHTTSTAQYYGGRSVVYFVEVTSAPVNDNFYTAFVSLGSAKVVMVYKRNYQYTFVPSNSYSFNSNNTLPTSLNQNVMEKDGDIVPDMSA